MNKLHEWSGKQFRAVVSKYKSIKKNLSTLVAIHRTRVRKERKVLHAKKEKSSKLKKKLKLFIIFVNPSVCEEKERKVLSCKIISRMFFK